VNRKERSRTAAKTQPKLRIKKRQVAARGAGSLWTAVKPLFSMAIENKSQKKLHKKEFT
jgi:hypothetical protein